MFVYISIYGLLAMLGASTTARSASGAMLALVALPLVLFMGTRLETGCDFSGYLHRFELLYNDATFFNVIRREEPGFHLLNWLVMELDLGYMWVNILASSIYVYCIFKFSKLSARPILLIALFFPILIVQLGMSGLRQALATGFLMLALVEFVSGNRLKTALYILVGALFHQSVIIMLPLALVAGRQITLSRLLIALVVLGPLAFVILGERAEVYNNRYVAQVYGENSSSGALLRYGLAALPFLFLVKYRNKVKSAHPQIFNLMWVFSFICFVMLPLAFLSTVALHRMVYYILPVSSLALISVASVVFAQRDRQMASYFPILLYGSYIVVWFSLSRHANLCYTPYDSYLFGYFL